MLKELQKVSPDATPSEARDSERRHELKSGEEHKNRIEEVSAAYISAEPYFQLIVDAIHVQNITTIDFGRDYEAYLEIWTSRDRRKELFYELTDEWKTATAFMSSVTDIAMHPAYQKIIGLGREAVPLILGELQQKTDHWFWALKSITGIDPVPSEHRGNIDKMRDAWITWGQDNDLI